MENVHFEPISHVVSALSASTFAINLFHYLEDKLPDPIAAYALTLPAAAALHFIVDYLLSKFPRRNRWLRKLVARSATIEGYWFEGVHSEDYPHSVACIEFDHSTDCYIYHGINYRRDGNRNANFESSSASLDSTGKSLTFHFAATVYSWMPNLNISSTEAAKGYGQINFKTEGSEAFIRGTGEFFEKSPRANWRTFELYRISPADVKSVLGRDHAEDDQDYDALLAFMIGKRRQKVEDFAKAQLERGTAPPDGSLFLEGTNPETPKGLLSNPIGAVDSAHEPDLRIVSSRLQFDVQGKITGKRLFEYKGYYPVDIATRSNLPSLNPEIFLKALNFFLEKANDRLAAMDLVYLREDNRRHLGDVLRPEGVHAYEQLIAKYDLSHFQATYSRETRRLFRNVERIVDDLGDTLRGVYFEIILHDVRNPLRSIIAVKNSNEVSKRRINDPSTRFVVQYVKNQGKDLIDAMESGSKVAYPKQFTKERQLKATTTPLFDDRYGLIGILCFNIDVCAIQALDATGIQQFIRSYIKTEGVTPQFERDEAPEA